MALTPTPYVYQRKGGPLLSWKNGIPPYQSRAADAKSLGSLGDDDVFGIQRPLLPRPGAPEYMDDQPDTLGAYNPIPSSSPPIGQRGLGGVPGKKKCGCGCKGKKMMKNGKCAGKKQLGEYVNAMGEYVGMGDDTSTTAAGQSSSSSIGTGLPSGPSGVMTVVPPPTAAPIPPDAWVFYQSPTTTFEISPTWFKNHPVATVAGAYVLYRLFFKK